MVNRPSYTSSRLNIGHDIFRKVALEEVQAHESTRTLLLIEHEVVQKCYKPSLQPVNAKQRFTHMLLTHLGSKSGCRIEWNGAELLIISDNSNAADLAIKMLREIDRLFVSPLYFYSMDIA